MSYSRKTKLTKTDNVTVTIIAASEEDYKRIVDFEGSEESLFTETISNFDGFSNTTVKEVPGCPGYSVRIDYHNHEEWRILNDKNIE